MGVITDEKKIDEILTRAVDEVIDLENLKKKLSSGEVLRIKLGIDPTSPNLHLGRSVPLLKLRDFQELGHKVVLIVGDFTGIIGDTSDKDSERPMLSKGEIKRNLRSYKTQVSKILDLRKAEFKFNSKWLKKLDFQEIGELTDFFSVNSFIKRDNVKRRLEEEKRVSLREVLYPVMQGYDSVAVKADVEIGGVDQRFNLLAGRTIQEKYNQTPQDIIMTTFPIEGIDGRKMSSSWGNTINFLDSPEDMFGKIMSVRDELVIKYLRLLTRVSMSEVEKYEKSFSQKPKEIKERLALEIVSMYHSEDLANKTKENWVNTFSKGKVPENIIEIENQDQAIDVLASTEFIKSKTEARKLLESGAVTNLDKDEKLGLKDKFQSGHSYRIGKHNFIKIK